MKSRNGKIKFSLEVERETIRQIKTLASMQKVTRSKAIREHLRITLPRQINRLIRLSQKKSRTAV